MKRTLLAVVALVVPAAALAAATEVAPQANRPRKQYTAEQLLKTTSLSGASFSADEKSVAYSSDESGVFNVYTVPASGGKARALTKNKDSSFVVAYFPKDDRVLYTHDRGGDENNHLYVLDGGKERDLTPGKLKAQFGGFSHDLAGLYVLTNERDAKFFDVYRYDAKTYERTLIYKDEAGYDFAAVSNDGKWLAFAKSDTTANSNMYVYSVDKGKLELLSKHTGTAQYEAQAFDVDSRWLYFTTNDGGEFLRARRYELATGKTEDVQKADWDITSLSLTYGNKYSITLINMDGHTLINVVELSTHRSIDLPKLPDGDITNVVAARSETKLALFFRSDRRPADLYVWDIPTNQLTRLTDTLAKEVDPEDLVDSKVVRFKSFDGMEIPNIFYKPHQASAEHKAPALVYVHGGPGGQTRAGYDALIQYLANHGYVILGINNRGSSGYGKTFYTADDRKHGHEPLEDCVYGKKYLQSLDYVDPQRIGILGGSYGGYMVLAALAFKPDEFTVGVDLFGVANWVRVLKSIPPYWESFRLALYAEIGDPEKDEAMLKEISPLFHIEKIKKPLLVLQGHNDPRVLQIESDEVVAGVKKNHVPVEYVVFADEGHGFTKKKNKIVGYKKILDFLNQYLKNAPPTQ
jgi:dipeptidyl aminopeptidase/acylaminoacyl peptidase